MSGPDSASARIATVFTRLRELYARRETVRYLVTSNLKAGHRNKVLGNLWNLLDPLLSLGVYFLVFGVWLGQGQSGRGDYLIYLFIGILAWRFLDGAISQSVNCIRGNRGLISEINFPKSVFPLAICLSRLYDLLWGLIVLVAVLLLTGHALTWHACWMVPLLLVQLVFVTGIAYIVAYLGAFFADTANIVTVILRLMFYASPILYYTKGEGTRIPEHVLPYYMLNPIAGLLEGFRAGLTAHANPSTGQLVYLTVTAVVVLLSGFALFTRGEGKFAKYV